jgi:hypothetical protein
MWDEFSAFLGVLCVRFFGFDTENTERCGVTRRILDALRSLKRSFVNAITKKLYAKLAGYNGAGLASIRGVQGFKFVEKTFDGC